MVAFVQTEAAVIKTDVRTIIPKLSREAGGQTYQGRQEKSPTASRSTDMYRAFLTLHEVQTVILKMEL